MTNFLALTQETHSTSFLSTQLMHAAMVLRCKCLAKEHFGAEIRVVTGQPGLPTKSA